MVLLFVDNSNKIMRILLQTQDLYTEYHIFNSKNKSNSIISDINTLLSDNNLTPQQITKVAYVNSGLSFTGLRLALSTLMAIAYVNKAQIFSVDPYISILLQYLQQNSSLTSRYYAVILPSHDHRSSIAIVEYDGSQCQVLTRYSINVNEGTTIIIPEEYKIMDDLTIINALPNLMTQRFVQNIKFKHLNHEISIKMIESSNFELSYISQLIINNYFNDIDLHSLDLLY